MIYKGQEIQDKVFKERTEEYKHLYDNDFYLDLEDLNELREALAAKAIELTQKGIDFKDLDLNFYATEFHENDNGPDDSSDCIISFSYMTLETDEESKARIEREKHWIDEKLKKEERKREAEKLTKEIEIRKAKETLQKYGLL